MGRALTPLLIALLLPIASQAQVTPLGGSFVTTAGATTPGCSDNAGGVGISPATAGCTDPQGYTALASSEAGFSQDASGGTVTAASEAAATSTGGPPLQQSSGVANGSASTSWTLAGDTLYSLATDVSGGGFVNFSGSMGSLPPSGVLPAGSYGLSASTAATAVARDVNGAETVTATPSHASGELVLVPVGSPTLVQGTILAGGVAMSGLLIEARDAGSALVDSALTGDDGFYLLDAIPVAATPVTLHISAPAGGFLPQVSPPLAPPATYDADLQPAASVPLGPVALWLAAALLLSARSALPRS